MKVCANIAVDRLTDIQWKHKGHCHGDQFGAFNDKMKGGGEVVPPPVELHQYENSEQTFKRYDTGSLAIHQMDTSFSKRRLYLRNTLLREENPNKQFT